MSGGVDSSVTAAILKEEGHEVHGITMKVWGGASPETRKKFEQNHGSTQKHACYGPGEEQDIEDASKVCKRLGIPFTVIDLAKEYEEFVVSYFKNEYLAGKTPNPCVRCNARVKFGFLLDRAEKAGINFDFFATGHYVRKSVHAASGTMLLRKAKDPLKDQSYFLSFLSQDTIKRVLFPLGDLKKEEVRTIAKRFGLSVSEKDESQDFIEGDYGLLFGSEVKPGLIIDQSGKKLGEHRGIIYYTLGQRKGLGIGGGDPLFVTKIDAEKNTVVVGPREQVMIKSLIVDDMNWLISPKHLNDRNKVFVKVRLAHKEAPAAILPQKNHEIKIVFDDPQLAVTPGQIAAVYEEDLLVGAGTIQNVSIET